MGSINLLIVFLVVSGTFFTIRYSIRLGIYLFFKNLGLRTLVIIGEEAGILGPMGGLFLVSVVAGGAIAWGWVPSYLIILSRG